MIPGSTNQLLTAQRGYRISNSLRFRSSASAYLNRTPASTGNRQKWTWSAWVKRGAISQRVGLFAQRASDTPGFQIEIQADNTIGLFSSGDSGAFTVVTNAVFRDPSAWYHIVATIDTTLSSGRCVVYVNNVSQPFSTNTTSLNYNTGINTTNQHEIGRLGASALSPLDGYMAEVNFIDGQALTPSSFGETDAVTGVWMPKKYTGTYGTNGFYLTFSDNSGATATTIGKDSSGNGNNWTPNNISVTSGVTYDSMIDTPTNFDNGGNGAGNYAVLNPLDKGSIITLSAANLTCDYSGTATDSSTFSTIAFDAGTSNFYAEFTLTAVSLSVNGLAAVGIADVNTSGNANISTSGIAVIYIDDGSRVVNGTSTSSWGATWTTNDTIGVYVNQGTITFYKNGVSQGNAATGVTGTYKFMVRGRSGVSRSLTMAANFGQRAFSNTPSGAKSLCTQNLTTPTILAGNKYFDATTYAGNNTSQLISNSGSFQPDFVWIKNRTGAYDHILANSVIGANINLYSNRTNAEVTNNSGGYISAFNTTGFTPITGSTNALDTNATSNNYVAWQWNAASSNTTIPVNAYGSTPSIASTVRANTTAGFSIVNWTGSNATSNETVGHGLGVTPSMVILKNRNVVDAWFTYHVSATTKDQYLVLNGTAAVATATNLWGNGMTSTTVGIRPGSVAPSTSNNIVMYCFAPVAGYSAFGSYTGNGSADGPFVYLGFRPRWIMWKRSDSTGSWFIYDTARSTTNVMGLELYPNSSDAEAATTRMDFLSNGFKLRAANPADNASGGTYIYAAFAENPFKISRAR